jgi:hypothetical protein
MMARLLEYLHQRRIGVKWLFFAALVILPVIDLFVERYEDIFVGDRIPCFWSMFGLVVSLLMIVVWKWLAHAWLERDEDYYDK